MNIYTIFKPTYLYIKTHNITGIKYFGKTVKPNPHIYKGSGKRWLNHIKKYGNDVSTEIYGYYTDYQECMDAALSFSLKHNIDKSNEWANIIIENGINGGGDCAQMHTTEVRQRVKNTVFNKYGVEHISKSFEIKHKQQETYIKTYGNLGITLSSPVSVEKRNQTNLERYGSKCAANKNGNINSKLAVQTLIKRQNVVDLKILSNEVKVKLPIGWHCKNDEWIQSKIFELSMITLPCTDTSNYNKSQLIRHQLLNRSNVKQLMQLRIIYNLKLGNNWFQKNDEWIDNKITEVMREYQHNHPHS